MNPRKLALRILLSIAEKGAYSNIVLDNELSKANLSEIDARLVTALVYGVLERRAELDQALSVCSSRNLESLTPAVLTLLRMGAYQLLFMDRIPHFAAINETVNLAKKCKEYGAVGYLNGVLRELSRIGNLPHSEKKPLGCQRYAELWKEQYGGEIAEGLLASLAGRPPLTIRVNTLKTTVTELIKTLQKEGISPKRIVGFPHALQLENTGSIRKSRAFRDGLFHVQDLSSQICCEIAGVNPENSVIDVCAAPGGKSFTLAQLMRDSGKLISCDLYSKKVEMIRSGAERLGITVIEAMERDAAQVAAPGYTGAFDVVLCDLPCSGLGVLRRKPEIYDKKDNMAQGLPQLQRQLLDTSSALVKPGGTLIYSTCTLNQAENQQVADEFLARYSDFMPLSLELPQGINHAIIEPSHCITLFPHIHNTDGFFISKFMRQAVSGACVPRTPDLKSV